MSNFIPDCIRCSAVPCLIAFALMLTPEQALPQAGEVSIKAFEAGNQGWDDIEITLLGATNTTSRLICLEASARSKDGTVRSTGTAPASFPVGSNQKITTRVTRPYGESAQQTHQLVITVYECGRAVYLAHIFLDWPFEWPEKRVSPNDKGAKRYSYLTKRTVKSWEAIYSTYIEEDFPTLDLLTQRWSNPNERDKDGEWKLDGFREGYDYLLQLKDWEGNLQRIRKWRKANPTSDAAIIAEVHHWIASAKYVRGKDNIANIDPIAMKLYRERMGRAEKLLQGTKGVASKSPLWHELALEIAIDTKRSPAAISRLFQEAIGSHPEYFPLYFAMANQWIPSSWEAMNWSKLDDLANLAATSTSKTDGTSGYARVYAHIATLPRVRFNIFGESLASWQKMKKSFEDMVARYPSAQNLNSFAMYACLAGDKETFLSIRPKILNSIVKEAWPSNYSLDLCDRRFMQFS